MSKDEFTNKIRLRLENDMIFKCDIGIANMKLKDCYIDETNIEQADMWGPNPTMLLASAVAGCLSASLIFCLKKKNFTFDEFEAEAELKGGRNEKG